MSFTRFHDDPNRIQKTNLERSAINDYTFNVTGNTKGSHFFMIHIYEVKKMEYLYTIQW